MRLRPSFSSLIPASLVAGLASFASAVILRALAGTRVPSAPGVLDRLHAMTATLAAPLGAACLGGAWILLCAYLETRFVDRELRPRTRAAILALLSMLTIG